MTAAERRAAREIVNPMRVLWRAGFLLGVRPSPGGRCNDSARGVAGFVLDVGMTPLPNSVRYDIVDHVGSGRGEALARYAAALTAAGFTVEIAAKSERVAKRVIHVRRYPDGEP